jgi:hypothetical protein
MIHLHDIDVFFVLNSCGWRSFRLGIAFAIAAARTNEA